MGLFDQILSAINDPNSQASKDQVGGIVNTVQQLANSQNLSPENTQTTMSMLGGYVRSALQDKRSNQGADAVQSLVNQFSGTRANPSAVNFLFPQQQQAQIAQAIAQRTGISANTIQGLLPLLIPVVLGLLSTGTDPRNPAKGGNNQVLNNFLDADGDGDVDVADAMRMAGKFLG
ncbi:MAG: DUF937 domain-containing protein [Oscillatoriales cyanobacterium RM2_1_1]|nr:DUF937 domain-containing protein [Oscillatoriales cyanobacterium SM2_3_0]NJO45335.1 DUF937 domain-containing protein [Oscillatoriales cyanobacterium RM2_1_1]